MREPDRAALAATIETAGRAGRDAFVVLDGDVSGDAPFLQATRLDDTAWLVEVWRVGPGARSERYRTLVADDATVTRVFWSWATGTDEWQLLRWHLVEAPLAAAG